MARIVHPATTIHTTREFRQKIDQFNTLGSLYLKKESTNSYLLNT